MSFDDYFVDLSQPNAESELVRMINTHGFATFDNIGNKQQFVELTKKFGSVVKPTHTDEYGGTLISPMADLDTRSAYLGLTDKELNFHTDRSSAQNPPLLLFMYCITPAQAGGDSKLLDGKRLYETLSEQHPDMLEKLLEPVFISRNSNRLTSKDVQQYVGPVFSENEDDIVSGRFRFDHLGYFYGPILSEIENLLEIMESLGISFRLEQGQGYVVNNLRCLHARTAFSGDRQMYRLLIESDTYAKLGQQIVRGFIPATRKEFIGRYLPKTA